jgi:serine/threonine protein phosphatase PrpC
MVDSGQSPDGTVRFGAVVRPLWPGEPVGDGYLFWPYRHYVLFALVDGLGHGRQAHDVTVKTLNNFRTFADFSLEQIIWETHKRIHDTRGCVAFLGRIDSRTLCMECISIGNITYKLQTKSETRPLTAAGILGHNLRKFTCASLQLEPEDFVVLCSDGISTKFNLEKLETAQPEDQAREIYQRYGHNHDDASVLVIRVGRGVE